MTTNTTRKNRKRSAVEVFRGSATQALRKASDSGDRELARIAARALGDLYTLEAERCGQGTLPKVET